MSRLKILNDFAFQKALGEKGDEPQLLAFLNATLERTGKGNLESVEILEDKDLPPEIAGGKAGKLDVLAKAATGSRLNIEVQNKNEFNIEKRSLYYWSRKYVWDFRSGEDYRELLPVIGINILNFEWGKADEVHTSYHLWEDRHKEIQLTDVCELHFLDMVRFRRSGERDLENPLDRWLTFFDEQSPEELIEEVIKMDRAIGLTQEKMNLIARDPVMLRAYEKYEKAASDYTSGINGARREERQKLAQEIARNLKMDGISIGQITKWTGLNEDQIREL
jgi:predicted transposase/invertase (TIGR01784 family)